MTTMYLKGDSDVRPWGTWEVLESSNNYCVKKICVIPQGTLSLQLHHYRNEHWIIVEGEAVVTIGDSQMVKKADESVYIPVNTKHRISNKTDRNMVFIEVQSGENLDENDIVRFEDKYGRA
ncbi:MAG: phosphomannose isomerase type II C-terminal cupin domain [Alphaproteobacteria bacterium]|nr:phosphomannose isomerase type II C-terminal cupin domain [Alphaproteobacteria bacterium]